MYQEMDLIMLPPHLRNSDLKARTYFQWEFQFLFPEIWISGFLDLISINQRIRVLNYEKYMDMTEQKWCITCEKKWCMSHECQNSFFVFFNPFDRDDEADEIEDQEFEDLEEEIIEEGSVLAKKEYSFDGKGDQKFFALSSIKEKKDLVVVDAVESDDEFGKIEDNEYEEAKVVQHEDPSDVYSEEERRNYHEHLEELIDQTGNTTLCYATSAGSVGIAEMMVGKNPSPPGVRGNPRVSPLYMPAKDQDQLEEKAKENMQPDIFCSWKEAGSYDELQSIGEKDTLVQTLEEKSKSIVEGVIFVLERELDKTVEEEISMYLAPKLFDQNSEWELEQELVSLEKFLKSVAGEQFREMEEGNYEMLKFKFDPGGEMGMNWNGIQYVTCLIKPVGEKQKGEWVLGNFSIEIVNDKGEQSVYFRFTFDPGGIYTLN